MNEPLGDRAEVIPLGPTELKGTKEPVRVYRLESLVGVTTGSGVGRTVESQEILRRDR
jgi:class 3 adenylate cyclase